MKKRKFLRILGAIGLVLLLGLLSISYWGYRQLAGSLPKLDGTIAVNGLSTPVTVSRDALGVPTIAGTSRMDVAYALGFAHGQDRFFQMDLLRRNSAGELAELIGPAILPRDKQTRIHQFRNVARQRVSIERPEVVELFNKYTDGVNAGLASLNKPPFEYLLMGLEPQPWKPEDCLLVVFSMFLDLQGDQFQREVDRGLLHDSVPLELYEFLMARGDNWDAPIDGQAFEVPAVPGVDVFDARANRQASNVSKPPVTLGPWREEEPYTLGSNNWAVSGKFTRDGRALIADDMHLRIQVPHIWYRARWTWFDDKSGEQYQMTGVSLPGTPVMIVGSNGNIAWGYTNTEGDWNDVVIVDVDSQDRESYQTPDGLKKFERQVEEIKVKGAASVELPIVKTIWGPVVAHDHRQRPLVSHWVAYQPEGVNVDLIELETVKTVDQALEKANRCGIPHQNFVVGDAAGNIAWTVAGKIPNRFGHDGRLPQSWADGSKGWDGFLDPSKYPRVVNPEAGKIWTANARVVGGEFYQIVGDSGYDRGARQQQIRDRLLALDSATEADMLDIQLDDRAVFLQRWQKLLLNVLSDQAVADNSSRKELRALVDQWGARASIDSAGYLLVQNFRTAVISQVSDLLCQPLTKLDPNFSLHRNRRIEGPIWKLIEQRPENFLDPRFETWDQWLLACADSVIKSATDKDAKLSDRTWGRVNTTQIQHPLSKAIPALASYLDMPAQPLNGGWSDMPRIQAPSSGASQRMAVSPGREQDGYMQIPCGQSGHPLSPYYMNSHEDWVSGKPTPFLPGVAEHVLELTPK